MPRKPEIVWLVEERIFAELISQGAYVSIVRYSRGGIDYEELVDNDEFEYNDEGDDDIDSDED